MAATEVTTGRRSQRSTSKRSKKIDSAVAEREKKEAVEAAIAKARLDARRELEEEQEEESFGTNLFEDPSDDGDDETSTIFGGEHGESNEGFDIFQYAQKEYEEKGKPVVFYVKKDNEIMGQLPAPCDWTILQKKYGGGVYQVTARHAYTKQYIKSQTERVGEPERRSEGQKDQVVIQTPAAPSADLNEMFKGMSAMFMQMQEMTNRDKSREDREEKKSAESFNNTFLQLLTQQQNSTMQMFTNMQEGTNRIMEKLGDNFSKVVERQDDKMNKMFEKLADNQSKKENISTMDLIKLMETSRKDGIDTMTTLMELAEAKAEAMAGDGESKESLLGTLVKGIAPILANANRSMVASQPRGAVSRPPSQHLQAPAQGTGGVRAPQNRQAAPRPANQPHNGSGGVQGQGSNWKSALGLPVHDNNYISEKIETIIPNSLAAEFVDDVPGVVESKPDVSAPERDTNDLYQNANMTQKLIAEMAIPTIAAYLFNDEIKASDVAHICLNELESQGITPQVVVKEFTFDFLLQIASSFGVAEEKKSWLEEYYAEIEDIARMGAIGDEESALS